MRFTGLFILGALTLSTISSANAQYVFGISSKVRSQISEPAVGQSYVDPDFGGVVTRLTDAAVMGHHNGMVSAVGDQTHGISNEYSRVRTENADGSKILLLHYESASDPT